MGLLAGLAIVGMGLWSHGLRAADTGKSTADQRVLGRELFEREWLPGDSRSHGGDGLGPVYNDSSCIACHNLGGTGGGGSSSKNVDILTATPNAAMAQGFNQAGLGGPEAEPSFLGKALGSLVGLESPQPTRAEEARPAAKSANLKPAAANPARRKPDTRELVQAHPGFRTARSIVLHRFGTESDYQSWRMSVAGFGHFVRQRIGQQDKELFLAQASVNFASGISNNMGAFVLVGSQRNPTALFGAGLLDGIPDRAIEEAAQVKHQGFPEIAGRISRLKDKRIGRMGWKAQTATLEDFVLTACAVELGLEVPGHHQGGSPQKPDAKAKGLDLNAEECGSLVVYVRSLPRPAEQVPATVNEAKHVADGRKLFTSVGCATCHVPRLGNVDGIYSDLLLHDMGPQLGDTGQYGVFDPSSSEEEVIDEEGPVADAAEAVVPEPRIPFGALDMATAAKRPKTGPASRFEWRTPPLWGFRDSAPYLHDGRAATLDQAIALHAGEAFKVTRAYFGLSPLQRRQVETFLKSLTAPPPAELLARGGK
jgi:CxxC motif-containing protein (DUF1111 family)